MFKSLQIHCDRFLGSLLNKTLMWTNPVLHILIKTKESSLKLSIWSKFVLDVTLMHKSNSIKATSNKQQNYYLKMIKILQVSESESSEV